MKVKYYWQCSWDNGKGGFNPDYECCRSKGGLCNTPERAAEIGLKHVQQHRWAYWGYPTDINWRDTLIHVYERTPNGKTIRLGTCKQVLSKSIS